MRFVRKAGLNLMLACLPVVGLGCASMTPKMSARSNTELRRTEARQYQTARDLEQQGKIEQARDIYSTLHRRSPNTVAFAHRLAVVSTRLGDHATANRCFERAKQLDPSNSTLVADMGYSAFVQEDYPQAETLLREAVRLNPKDQRAVNNLAMAIGFQGRYDESLTTFREANSEAQSLNNLAYIYNQQADTAKAIDCYRRSIAIEPTNSTAVTALAQLESPKQPATLDDKPSRPVASPNQREKMLAHLNEPDAASPSGSSTATTSSWDELSAESQKPVPKSADIPELAQSALPPLKSQAEFKAITSTRSAGDWSESEGVASNESQIKRHLANSTAETRTAGHTQNPLIDDDAPYFEDQEVADRAGSSGRPVIASIAALDERQKAASSNVPRFEKPKIVPFGADESEDETPVTQVVSVATSQVNTQVVRQGWDQETAVATKPSNPPQALPEEANDEEEADELAGVFGSVDQATETKLAESEDLDDLDWVKDEQALLPTPDPDTTEDPVARSTEGLKGFCPVAIRDERRLAEASDQFTFEFQSQLYWFSSAEARDKFEANPERYAPVAGGLDIVAVRSGDIVSNGSLDFAVWYRHRLHLFSTAQNLASFRAAPRTFASVQ